VFIDAGVLLVSVEVLLRRLAAGPYINSQQGNALGVSIFPGKFALVNEFQL
jgi:hypothetical protein